MKKFFSYLLAICMILSLMCTMMIGTSAAEEFDKWDGTTTDTAWFSADKDYFELDTAAKLAGLAYLVNEYQGDDHKDPGAFLGKTFVITKNIDLGGHQWTPIGISNNYAFAGMLEGKLGGIDGEAVTIANMKIGTEEAPHETKNIGLVGSQGAGGIKNIYLTGAYINTIADTAGSFVGYSRPQKTGSACEYSNLRSDATIITGGAKWCGGIVAYSNIAGNLFKDCVYTGNITTKNSSLTMVGGITGNTNTSTDLVNCYVSGDIIADCKQVGGIIGTVTAKTTINLTNCQFDGTVLASATQAGAFIGIALELFIVLVGVVAAITASQNCAVNMAHYFFPIDFALMLTHIDQNFFHVGFPFLYCSIKIKGNRLNQPIALSFIPLCVLRLPWFSSVKCRLP